MSPMSRRRPPRGQSSSIPLSALAVAVAMVAAGQSAIALGLAAAATFPSGNRWAQPAAALALVLAGIVVLVVTRLGPGRRTAFPHTARILVRAAIGLEGAALVLAVAALCVGLFR